MYVRLAPQDPGPERQKSIDIYHLYKKNIAENNPRKFWQKPGQPNRRLKKVDAGNGGLAKATDFYMQEQLGVYYVIFYFELVK